MGKMNGNYICRPCQRTFPTSAGRQAHQVHCRAIGIRFEAPQPGICRHGYVLPDGKCQPETCGDKD